MEVLGLAFIYFITLSPSAKHGSLNCLFSDAQRIEWWLADVVFLELQKSRTNMLFQCLSRAFFKHVDPVSFGLVDASKLHLC